MTSNLQSPSILPGLSDRERGLLTNICGTKHCSLEDATLKLAFLKENTEYQKFYDDFRCNPNSYLSISPIPECDNPPRRLPYPRFTRTASACEVKDLGYYFRKFGQNPNPEVILFFIGWLFTDFLTAFDPEEDLSRVSNQHLIEALSLFFSSPAIRHFSPGYTNKFFYDDPGVELGAGCGWSRLSPYEHILVVDLRKQTGQLLDEFKHYIDERREEWKYCNLQEGGLSFRSTETYREWEPDGRERVEIRQHLRVWQLRSAKVLPV